MNGRDAVECPQYVSVGAELDVKQHASDYWSAVVKGYPVGVCAQTEADARRKAIDGLHALFHVKSERGDLWEYLQRKGIEYTRSSHPKVSVCVTTQ